MKTAAKTKLVAPKAFRRRIILFFWLAIAALQLLLSASIAPAKSTLELENRVWEIFSLAAQSHQANQLQVAEAQRERAPPQRSAAPDSFLGPETTASILPKAYQGGPGAQWTGENLTVDAYAGNQSLSATLKQGEFDFVNANLSGKFPTNPSNPPAGVAVPYGDLNGTLEEGFQANHLNQDAAFRDVIPSEDGLAIGMRGNAFTEPDTPHYDFHASLEQFWSQYRPNGDLFGLRPTNALYDSALQDALQAGGFSPDEAARLANQAAQQRLQFGLIPEQPVPRVPGRLPQKNPVTNDAPENISNTQ